MEITEYINLQNLPNTQNLNYQNYKTIAQPIPNNIKIFNIRKHCKMINSI